MKHEVPLGQQDYSVLVKIRTDAGAPATGLDEGDIDIAYARVETDNDVTTTDVTPAALSALTDAHTDWGFEEVSATDHPGVYRLDIADAVFASGAWSAVVSITGTGLDPADLEFVLVAFNPRDAVRLGLTALPNANAEAAGGLYTRGSGAGQIAQDANGRVNVNVAAIETADPSDTIRDAVVDDATRIDASALNTLSSHDPGETIMGATDTVVLSDGSLTAAKIASDAITAAKLHADVTTELQSGLATAANLATVAGYIDTEVAAIKAVTDKLDDTLEDQGGGTYGFTEAALQEAPTGGSAPSAADIADAVWEEAIADHSGTSGSTAEALNAAGAAGDPWITALPGSYTSGQAGYIVGTNLDAPVSDVPDAMLDQSNGVETGLTVRGALRLALAALAGKLSGANTSTTTIRNVGDTKNRIVATTDATGRTSVTTDAS